ncbi:MAG: hypothetical protein E6I37_16410, partial [Chloroflexi bacterium]
MKGPSIVVAVVVLTLLVAANVAASRSTQAMDLTRDGLNTLTPQSVGAARSLQADAQLIGLFRPGTGNGQAETEALIALYTAQSPHVTYRRENFDT